MKFSPKALTSLLLLSTTSPVFSSKHVLRKNAAVMDATAPGLVCNQDVTLDLGGTSVTLVSTDVYTSASDNVTPLADLVFSFDDDDQTTLDCSNIGNAVAVTLTVADEAGNEATCNSNVDTADGDPPTAVCQDVTVTLDAIGSGSITTADVNNGSTDNCDDSLDLTLGTSSFGCSDVGANTVTLTAMDDEGNSATCTSTVTVSDNTPPTFSLCENDTDNPYMVQLTDNGGGVFEATVSQSDVAVASDVCGGVWYDFTSTTYTCDDVGENTFDVTAIDSNGNDNTCSVVVDVFENEDPVAVCVAGPIMKVLNTATASLTVAEVDNGSSDNCDIGTITLSQEEFTCANVGDNTVTMTVTDTSGNTDTCTVMVTVADDTNPQVDCRDVTLSIGSNGMLTIVPEDVLVDNDPADDNCGVPTTTVLQSTFMCSDVGSTIAVQVVAEDDSGNSDSCFSDVTIVDTVSPDITCADQTVTLDSTGAGSLDTNAFTATDNCSSSVAKTFSQEIFGCVDVGSNAVSVTFSDDDGNESSCNPTITVTDTTAPDITCPASIAITASAAGSLSVPLSSVQATDSCGATLSTPDLVYDCDNTETSRSIVVTATDPSGNTDSCTIDVTITPEFDCDECGFICTILSAITCGVF